MITSERNGRLVRPLRRADLPEIVQIHSEQFRAARSTQLGEAFVTGMYAWFLDCYPALAFVAVDRHRVVGFVVGSVGGYGRRIARAALPQILAGLLRRPSLLIRRGTFRQWRSLLVGLLPRHGGASQTYQGGRKVSLASIAVAADMQGRGVGTQLITALEAAAREQKLEAIGLSVALDNVAARQLYVKAGWKLRSEDIATRSAYYFKRVEQEERHHAVRDGV